MHQVAKFSRLPSWFNLVSFHTANCYNIVMYLTCVDVGTSRQRRVPSRLATSEESGPVCPVSRERVTAPNLLQILSKSTFFDCQKYIPEWNTPFPTPPTHPWINWGLFYANVTPRQPPHVSFRKYEMLGKKPIWALFVAQLADQSLAIAEVYSSNPVISKFLI